VSEPDLFGVDPDARFQRPDGGDRVSMRIAQQIHLLLCDWNRDRRPSAAALAERFDTSKQTISRVSRGERWPGETVMAALVHAARQDDPSPERASLPTGVRMDRSRPLPERPSPRRPLGNIDPDDQHRVPR